MRLELTTEGRSNPLRAFDRASSSPDGRQRGDQDSGIDFAKKILRCGSMVGFGGLFTWEGNAIHPDPGPPHSFTIPK